MKTLFIQLVLIVVFVPNVFSQRVTDPPYTAEHFNGQYRANTTIPININFSDTSLFCAQPNQFLFGYQWGGGANLAMERRFGTNSPHIQQYAGHDTNSIKALKTGATLYGVYSYQSISNVQQFQTTCMEYRPCAPLWDSEHEYIPVPGDKTGAIFGFNTKIDSCVITDSTSPEFMRYVVKPSILNGLSSKLILGRPWESSHPIRTGDTVSAKNNPNHIEAMKNGTRWYLNVNVRRLNNDSTQTDNQKVLTLKIRYWYKAKNNNNIIVQYSDSIQFDSVFTYNNTSDTMHTARGITHRNLSPVNFGDKTQFIIRRKDIPVYGSVDSLRDISLSAYFRTASIDIVNDTFSTKHTPNLWFQRDQKYQLNAIDSFDIQVTYNGGCPISISHISLLTPRAKELLFGYADKALADGLDTLVSDVRTLHNKYLDSNKYLKLYRIYTHDEPQPRTWRIERYLNKLFGGYITAKGTELTAYQHLVGQKDFWNGNGIDQMNRQRTAYKVSNPQNKNGLELAGWNWNDIPNGIYGYQKYECIECYNNWKYGFPTNGSTKLPDVSLPSNTYQSLCAMEENAKNIYLNKAMVFSGMNWSGQFYTSSRWTYGTEKDTSGNFKPIAWLEAIRPKTGEEVRRAINWFLILGAKGIRTSDYGTHTHKSLSFMNDSAQYYDTTFTYGFMNHGLHYQNTSFYDKVSPTDATGELTLKSYQFGHDYFTPTNLETLWEFTRKQATATEQQVDTNHIYIGMRSNRYELMKQYDKIRTNENTILSMELLAWSGKGFNWFRIAKNNDTSLYKRFVDLTWEGVKTHTVGNSVNENWDSVNTFVDVSIHKVKGLSYDSTFVISCLNRHTNSLVLVNPSAPLYPDKVKFYSTFEFDSLVMAGQLGKYSQLGSREITIPFTYRHPDTKTRLLHIQELTSDSTVKGIDTVICQSCSLTAKYLPGEGRIFRITIVKPQDRFADRGSLDYVSQHKLIAMPKLIGIDTATRKPIYDSAHVRYHLVFHRTDTIMGPFGSTYLSKVIYKRSKLIERCAQYDVANPVLTGLNVVWDTTAVLSDTIYKRSSLPGIEFDTVNHFPCRYPSLVVRFDTTDLREYVYCVFACQKDSISPLLIMESQFASIPKKAHEIGKADSSNIDTYGHPVINASYKYNYYSYSSYLDGINIGSRHTDTSNWAVTWSAVSAYSPRNLNVNGSIADSRHPSVNTYSNLNNEGECALVWQEKNAADSTSVWGEWHVYYTRLYHNDFTNTTYHELPSIMVGQNGHNIDTLDGTKARISVMPLAAQGFHQFKLPSVERMSFPNVGDKYYHSDKVVFQGDSSIPCNGYTMNRSGIFLSNISSIRDSITAPEYLSTAYGGTIFSCITTLNNPTGTHAMNWYFDPSHPRPTDSSYVLNFDLPEFGWLAHITQGYLNWGSPIQYIENAERSQLVHQPFITEDYHWTFVRRALTTPSNAANKNIFSSGTELLKRGVLQKLSHYLLSGFQYGTSRFALADIISNSSESSMRSGRKSKQERLTLRDSLASDWFNVYQDKIIKFVLADNDVDVVSMSIENKRTQQRVPIDVRSLSPQDGRKVKAGRIVLRNGGGDEYRFVLGKTNEQAQYYEDVYIGDIPELLSKATTEDDYSVDVSQTLLTKESNQLLVYPNPSNKEALIRFEGLPSDIETPNYDYTLEFTDALGKTILKRNIKAKETLTLNIQAYTEGIYYFHVRGSMQSVSTPLTILK